MFTKKIKKRNLKNKFNEDKYVETHYIREDGKAYIPIDFPNLDDLFMKHDYKKLEIDDDVCKYIEYIAYMIPINTDLVFEIHCPKIDEEKQERIRSTFRNNYGMEIDDSDYHINKINKKSLLCLIIGLGFLIINILTEKYISPVLTNFITVIWWVTIWETISSQIFDKVEYKWKRLNYLQLYDAEIIFVFDK